MSTTNRLDEDLLVRGIIVYMRRPKEHSVGNEKHCDTPRPYLVLGVNRRTRLLYTVPLTSSKNRHSSRVDLDWQSQADCGQPSAMSFDRLDGISQSPPYTEALLRICEEVIGSSFGLSFAMPLAIDETIDNPEPQKA